MSAVTFRQAMVLKEHLDLQWKELELLVLCIEEPRVSRSDARAICASYDVLKVHLCHLNRKLPENCQLGTERTKNRITSYMLSAASRAHLLSLIQDQARAA